MISYPENREWKCDVCGRARMSATWLAIDAVERPDLVAAIAEGRVVSRPCAHCDSFVLRKAPLLVTRLAKVAPVLLAVPDSLIIANEPPESMNPVIERVREALGDEMRDVPGPLLLVPFDVIVEAAGRNLDADIKQGPGEGSGELSAKYNLFLEEVQEMQPVRRFELGLNWLVEADSRERLGEMLVEFPELVSSDGLERFSHALEEASPEEQKRLRWKLELLQVAATGDVDRAWREHEEALRALWQERVAMPIRNLQKELAQAVERGLYEEGVQAGEEILRIARLIESEELELETALTVADGLHYLEGYDRPRHLERARVLYERGLEILEDRDEQVGSDVAVANVLLNLGVTYASRIVGDPLENLRQAIYCLRRALGSVSLDEHPDMWAMVQTNLALCILEISKRDDRESLNEAIERLEAALQWRSFERDPVDWAFTQLNLGLAVIRLEGETPGERIRQALYHYKQAARGAQAGGSDYLWGQAQHNLAAEKLQLVRLAEVGEEEKVQLLEEARQDIEKSLEARPPEAYPVARGRSLSTLGDLLRESEDWVGAKECYRGSLQLLTSEGAPHGCLEAATALAALEGRDEEWERAAETWEVAAEAALVAFESRGTAEGRLEEVVRSVNVFRWAAYALTRVGRLERAVEVLELGRARELAGRLRLELLNLQDLRALNPELCDRFVEVRASLEDIDHGTTDASNGPLGGDRMQAVEDFRRLVLEIRELPGFERFLARTEFREVADALDADEVLVYIVTSPDGSCVLLVSGETDPGVGGSAVDLVQSTITSKELVSLFVPGADASQPSSYILAQAGEAGDLDEILDAMSDKLGELLRTIRDGVVRLGGKQVCLVPIGLMGLVPLHALEWTEEVDDSSGEGGRCLIDDMSVLYAPSGIVHGMCVDRAHAGRERDLHLLAVGNPLPHPQPLSGAEWEVRVIAEALSPAKVDLLIGEEATRRAFEAHFEGATHVHLACHGGAQFFGEPLSASLSFAGNEGMGASEIAQLNGEAARMVVASACQTAVFEGYDTSDEVFSLATSFIAAGAAGVVATLWSVDDFATALLMCRFYELLGEEYAAAVRSGEAVGHASALREAQQWLRRLNVAEEAQYVKERPLLRQYRARSENQGMVAPFDGEKETDRQYESPRFWAPFVLVGA